MSLCRNLATVNRMIEVLRFDSDLRLGVFQAAARRGAAEEATRHQCHHAFQNIPTRTHTQHTNVTVTVLLAGNNRLWAVILRLTVCSLRLLYY